MKMPTWKIVRHDGQWLEVIAKDLPEAKRIAGAIWEHDSQEATR